MPEGYGDMHLLHFQGVAGHAKALRMHRIVKETQKKHHLWNLVAASLNVYPSRKHSPCLP